MAKGITVNLIM